jgi:hypothetical protein
MKHWNEESSLIDRPGGDICRKAAYEEYTYLSPVEVLEKMLVRTAIYNSERYGEYLSHQSDLATRLRGLLRDEALTVFESGDCSPEW